MRSLGFAVAIAAVGVACSSSSTPGETNVADAGDAGREDAAVVPDASDAGTERDAAEPDAAPSCSDAGAPVTTSDNCYVDSTCSQCGNGSFAYWCGGADLRPNVDGCIAGILKTSCCPAACVRWTDADTGPCKANPTFPFGFACPMTDDGQLATSTSPECYLHSRSKDHPNTAVVCCKSK